MSSKVAKQSRNADVLERSLSLRKNNKEEIITELENGTVPVFCYPLLAFTPKHPD